MKILILLGGFFPAKNYGGPPVSISNLCNLLKGEYEFYIVTRNREFKTNELLQGIEKGWNNNYNAQILYLDPNEFNAVKFNEVLQEIKPDLIYLNSLFSHKILIPFLKLSKKNNIPLLIAPRGELCANAFKKKYKKIPYILLIKMLINKNITYFQSTSNEEENAIMKYLKIKEKKIFQIDNIPSIGENNNVELVKNKGEMKSVFLSRIHPKKNLLFLIKCLSRIKGNVSLDIYGPIEDKEYWENVKEEIRKLPSNIKVKYLGNVEHEQVIETFKQYHTFLFYTLSENYGHVIVEAINASCVPIISDQTPWSDLVDYNAGAVSNINNIQECVNNIQTFVDYDNEEYKKILENLKIYKNKKINFDSIKEKYLLMFDKINKGVY